MCPCHYAGILELNPSFVATPDTRDSYEHGTPAFAEVHDSYPLTQMFRGSSTQSAGRVLRHMYHKTSTSLVWSPGLREKMLC